MFFRSLKREKNPLHANLKHTQQGNSYNKTLTDLFHVFKKPAKKLRERGKWPTRLHYYYRHNRNTKKKKPVWIKKIYNVRNLPYNFFFQAVICKD